jgi:hypothetical protein
LWLGVICLVACASVPGKALAQVIKADEWRKGTTLAVFGGAASGSGTHAATGASVGWEVLPHLTIDGSGIWETPSRGMRAFSALLGVRVNLTPPAVTVPFVSGGLGMYRATLDGTTGAPRFYGRRMTGSDLQQRYDFDDFAWSVGGGVDIFLQRHLALRPDVRVLLVHGPSEARAVPVYGLHLAYHFEEHVITP